MTPLVLDASAAVLPATLLTSAPVRILAAFVAINTVMYGALALSKVLPKMHPSRWLRRDNRRAEDRSIHPPS
ncbi:hypothetical protein [Cellulomonas soli]|uniref:Uncharacterized protein n=1 Tax=Cellulomonas soli TaxID=931535 RepID=A0A512PH91_9CELL|nr:hypothetical protein [Cellulomonas soli]NTW41895.1 hypothetical protein [Cellulomonadaceae bacterium]NYI60851.1 hypothetical protein [Cellulomonas soli]GEP70565.1 hypothetical protein CSO01_32800 [Cellulomonas soli]